MLANVRKDYVQIEPALPFVFMPDAANFFYDRVFHVTPRISSSGEHISGETYPAFSTTSAAWCPDARRSRDSKTFAQ